MTPKLVTWLAAALTAILSFAFAGVVLAGCGTDIDQMAYNDAQYDGVTINAGIASAERDLALVSHETFQLRRSCWPTKLNLTYNSDALGQDWFKAYLARIKH